ncbi:OTU domain-containing protein 5-A-like isoform X2 [Limulus polyphemus]|uniref:ubiquitinyl hydrolase 1 n=1 Tax=Limulus polyphemus TaxID=6850 RepID=A0ABM1TA07_LIMPO|nr:OTU domain-containing protein 5-A-like isoform X2 [Limulus polyphemus]
MTILPKKKSGQSKNEGEVSDPISQSHTHAHSYHGDRHGHQTHSQENRERFTFPGRTSPPKWPPPSTREDKRPTHSPSSNFDEFDSVDGGPSHSKRRHRASPHRTTIPISIRKSHSHGHSHTLTTISLHRSSGTQNFSNPGTSQTSHNASQERQNNQIVVPLLKVPENKDHSGYNSGDEYDRPFEMWTEEELEEREKNFEKKMRKKGFIIKEMCEDGACMFRAVADQVYGDQEMHSVVRKQCMDYMAKNADYYSQYVTEDFEKYIERKRCDHIHGNHVEMQALSEIFNRPIEVYHYSNEPINTFHGIHKTDNEPIRLSYHKNIHYNSISDPYKPTVGVGLGLPSFKPGTAEKSLITDAIRASEGLQLEQAMLEDKLRATDWEATNEAIEEQIARESYLEWLRENEQRTRKKTPSATETSSSSLSVVDGAAGGGMSPLTAGRTPCIRGNSSTSNSPRIDNHGEDNGCRPPEKGLTELEDTDILAKVLAQSQQEYLDSLKRSTPSTRVGDQSSS